MNPKHQPKTDTASSSKCPVCLGKGVIEYIGEKCENCEGTGKVTESSPEPVRDYSEHGEHEYEPTLCEECKAMEVESSKADNTNAWLETSLKAYTWKAWQMFQLGAVPDEVFKSSVFGEATAALSPQSEVRSSEGTDAQSEPATLREQITDICFKNGGATWPMVDKLEALLSQERAAGAREELERLKKDLYGVPGQVANAVKDDLAERIRELNHQSKEEE